MKLLKEYIAPEMDLLEMKVEGVIADSNLEKPIVGDEWHWE